MNLRGSFFASKDGKPKFFETLYFFKDILSRKMPSNFLFEFFYVYFFRLTKHAT